MKSSKGGSPAQETPPKEGGSPGRRPFGCLGKAEGAKWGGRGGSPPPPQGPWLSRDLKGSAGESGGDPWRKSGSGGLGGAPREGEAELALELAPKGESADLSGKAGGGLGEGMVPFSAALRRGLDAQVGQGQVEGNPQWAGPPTGLCCWSSLWGRLTLFLAAGFLVAGGGHRQKRKDGHWGCWHPMPTGSLPLQ